MVSQPLHTLLTAMTEAPQPDGGHRMNDLARRCGWCSCAFRPSPAPNHTHCTPDYRKVRRVLDEAWRLGLVDHDEATRRWSVAAGPIMARPLRSGSPGRRGTPAESKEPS